MRTITLELSKASCDKVYKELLRYQKEAKTKLDEICKRLAEIGAQEASIRAKFGRAYGNGDVSVSVEKIENGYKVVMSGADIYFIEFGTGDRAGEYAGDASNVSVGIMPGDWSETHAQQYSRFGYWFYNNTRYEGTPAEMPMYYAGKRMREEMPRIAREVFG